jgi:hypothetical protein
MTLFTITQMINKHILHPLQNISKSESKKLDVFGSKFRPNTFTFVDKLLLAFTPSYTRNTKKLKPCTFCSYKLILTSKLNIIQNTNFPNDY